MVYLASILPYFQILISVLLIITILLQKQGTGLSSAFGGEGNIYRTKRGFEKILFISTIILAVLFFVSASITLFISI